jgi:hypothetical protein
LFVLLSQSRSATKKCLPLQVCTPRARINTGDVGGVFPGGTS